MSDALAQILQVAVLFALCRLVWGPIRPSRRRSQEREETP